MNPELKAKLWMQAYIQGCADCSTKIDALCFASEALERVESFYVRWEAECQERHAEIEHKADSLLNSYLGSTHIDVVFDGPPGPEAGRFVEVEDASGKSISAGEWVHRDDGYWALRMPFIANQAVAPLEESRR